MLITGAEATADAIRGSVQRFDALHIATHALRDSESGEPALVLADGLLSTSEIETMISARLGSLVVLAACSTSRGRSSMDGNLSLARAFVAAGASAVVASLWDTDDRDAQFLFKRFYEELARGATAADALHVAQLSLLRRDSNVRPRRWAAYQIWGGA
jgi:CHAT domain-containing protein